MEPDDSEIQFGLGAHRRLGIVNDRVNTRRIPHSLGRANLETELIPELSADRVAEDKHGLVNQTWELVDVFGGRGLAESLNELAGLAGFVGALPVPFFGDPSGT
jgi:hypothetical protein